MVAQVDVTAAGRGARRPVVLAGAVSRSVVLVVLGVDLLVPGGWGDAAWVVLAVGLLCGLPHGAVDHLVPGWWLQGRGPHVLALALLYAGAVAATYLAFLAAPVAALVLFVVVSAWHFGTGDVGFHDLRSGGRRRWRWVTVAAHASVVLAVPVVWERATVDPVVSAVTGGSTVPDGLRTAVLLAAVVLVTGAVAVGLRDGRVLEVVELLLLVALVLVVTPLAAFGAYFGGWHSLRHLARVLDDDPANAAALAAGRIGPPLRSFARAAALPTLASLVALGLLWWTADGWRGFTLTYVALLAGLTVPHLVTVAWADSRRSRARTPA